ncbi:MAG: metal ABC transporter ATP-binding protein [Planctomycetota bacterium]
MSDARDRRGDRAPQLEVRAPQLEVHAPQPEIHAPPLEVHALCAGYAPGAAVVEDAAFALERGSMTALVGPNGAGKSTLLNALLGETPWRSGEVRFFGGALSACRTRVAVIPQRSAIDWSYPASALEIASMGLYAGLGLFRRVNAAARSAALAALDSVGLSDRARTQVGELSGGQQQRVLVARALAQRAELLLLDEPFANIDAASERRIAEVLRGLAAAGGTVLAVQHDLEGVRRHFDRAIVLNRRILAHASVSDALRAETIDLAYGLHAAPRSDGA